MCCKICLKSWRRITVYCKGNDFSYKSNYSKRFLVIKLYLISGCVYMYRYALNVLTYTVYAFSIHGSFLIITIKTYSCISFIQNSLHANKTYFLKHFVSWFFKDVKQIRKPQFFLIVVLYNNCLAFWYLYSYAKCILTYSCISFIRNSLHANKTYNVFFKTRCCFL